ncbi:MULTISPECIES: sugar phosphate nucleotidyltransferase [Virgibacillus]|uniref:Glucose-1-phosphate thymidylyltransferase n=2 Tax=Virgibacillus TaxID=84406 RepID=A0A024Q8T5_9BACI|nr:MULTISPECIES: sugar phosphate nucleotidyltransferase [Virgibacillus]EQB37778.1 hypothetical protein M948_04245 [Virgibacillus sp. CM-4]MYL40513.1 NTP transferase domain-containing protein [Virgibacillus massiliensis]GGJ58279.1 glucose-1-phosphate thymidylyltransferase [Virgibacillus kapii]CDQ38697.1 Glucose-1-phosphate thymidylyltransferase [Virgibacillus massiliensis]
MKGVILAGGLGTRLSPITKVINKHLLPVGCFPMIYHSIWKLKEIGVTDILLVINKKDTQDFKTIIGNGEALGVNIHYGLQLDAKGISDAVYVSKDFIQDDKFIVLLGDNLFEDSLVSYVENFKTQPVGAKIIVKQVGNPEQFGVASFNKMDNRITSILEKPKHPPSNYCVTGIYMYDSNVFKLIETLNPSNRGELEITDINNLYIQDRLMTYDVLSGWWIDAGTFQDYARANELILKKKLDN